jgi:post-segregation antitoxin (ccd killing protein)
VLYGTWSALPLDKMRSTPTRPDSRALDEGAQLLTRAQVARRLGVGASTVRRMEGRDLHPVVGADGVHRFDADEVEARRETAAGELRRGGRRATKVAPAKVTVQAEGKQHARAFRLFAAGRSHADVVIETAIPAAMVRQLYVEWRAGYREPVPMPNDLVEDDDAAFAREQREWADWEQRMQALSSDLELRPLRQGVPDSSLQHPVRSWSRRPGRWR